ncbi:histidine phosphatase family protein [Sulfitobacter pontiacus]|uniref:histidine phosphatase family protein n=1 Tax=Sulfitobacter pontiacus TaxID=60137 RepID=UPI0030ED874F
METSSSASIVLLRHGHTAWNRAGTLIGQTDIPLDAGGRQEAKKAVGLLTGIDAIYSSPLARCKETAEIIGACLGLQVKLLKGLSERHWGIFEGRSKLERDLYRDPEGGETIAEFRARVAKTLPRIVGARPLVVTHSGVIRLLSAQPHVRIPHAEPIELPFEDVASLR